MTKSAKQKKPVAFAKAVTKYYEVQVAMEDLAPEVKEAIYKAHERKYHKAYKRVTGAAVQSDEDVLDAVYFCLGHYDDYAAPFILNRVAKYMTAAQGSN